MDSIFDERDMGEEYRIEMDRRTGKTGEHEASHLVKNNKKLNELNADIRLHKVIANDMLRHKFP